MNKYTWYQSNRHSWYLRLSEHDDYSELAFIITVNRAFELYIWIPSRQNAHENMLLINSYPVLIDAINTGSELFDLDPKIHLA